MLAALLIAVLVFVLIWMLIAYLPLPTQAPAFTKPALYAILIVAAIIYLLRFLP